MKINISELVDLYDSTHQWDKEMGSPISSITGLIGEDLILGILEHYSKNDPDSKIKIEKISRQSPKMGRRGSKLDAWIFCQNKHYQVEIKNWSASAMDGVAVGDNDEELIQASIENHQTYLMRVDKKNAKAVWKVLETMQEPLPRGTGNRNSLLAFWSPVSASLDIKTAKHLKPFFEINNLEPYRESIEAAELSKPDLNINKVSIFSASIYLRELLKQKKRVINIDMPRVDDRVKRIKSLLTHSF